MKRYISTLIIFLVTASSTFGILTEVEASKKLTRDEAKNILTSKNLAISIDWCVFPGKCPDKAFYLQNSFGSFFESSDAGIKVSRGTLSSYLSCLENRNLVKYAGKTRGSKGSFTWDSWLETTGSGEPYHLTEIGQKSLVNNTQFQLSLNIDKITGIQFKEEDTIAKVFFDATIKNYDNPFNQCFEDYFDIQSLLNKPYAMFELFDDGWRFKELYSGGSLKQREKTSKKEEKGREIQSKEQPPKDLTLEAALQTERERFNKISTFKKLRMSSLITEGKNAMEKRDWNDAVQAYKKLLEIDPENYATYVNIGNAYAMLNEFDLSIQYLSNANQLIPAAPDPYVCMVYAYARKGDKERAIESLKNALDRGFKDVIYLKKDTDLPEDFRQDPRFKKLVGIEQSTQLQIKRLWSSSNTEENIIALTYKNAIQESDRVKADVTLANSTGTWIFVQQNLNPSSTAKIPVPGTYTYLLGPFTNKELGTIEFSKGNFLQLDARSPVGLKGSALDPANLSLLAAVATDLMMRGLFNKELSPNAFDNSIVLPTEVGLESIDPLFKTISSHCSGQLGALGNAIGTKNSEDALKAISGFALCTKEISEKLQEWLTKRYSKDVAEKYVKWTSKNIVDILDAPTRATLIGLLTKYTFASPPESWVRIEAIEQ